MGWESGTTVWCRNVNDRQPNPYRTAARYIGGACRASYRSSSSRSRPVERSAWPPRRRSSSSPGTRASGCGARMGGSRSVEHRCSSARLSAAASRDLRADDDRSITRRFIVGQRVFRRDLSRATPWRSSRTRPRRDRAVGTARSTLTIRASRRRGGHRAIPIVEATNEIVSSTHSDRISRTSTTPTVSSRAAPSGK